MRKTQEQNEYHAHDRLGVLMQQIVDTREQLAHPEEQSLYFKLGKENTQAILEGHIEQYKEKRALFNRLSKTALSYQLDRTEAKMQWVDEARKATEGGITPYIFWMGSLCGKRDRLEIYLKLKEITEKLPPVDELLQHKELIAELQTAKL